MEGERKQVTVLFADLKGSMELLADRDPEEARKILDPVLERMMEAVHHYEGTVNQVMGDGIMALFGAPLAHEDHAVRACYAALRMQDAVKRYAEEVRREHGVTIRIRLGLNSGEVVVRTIGSDLHMDYTAVGQTTHLAARLEQLADPGSILVAPDTLALAEGFVQVASLGPMAVKGLAAPVEVYELAGVSTVRSRLQAAAARGLSRFVGRDTEMGQLHRALGQAQQGRGQVAAVVGEPGVGKSRLTFELTHSHRVQGWLVLEARSVSYGKATSYLPMVDLLKGYFHIGDRDTAREIREKVTGKILTLDRALEPTLPALLALLEVIDDPEWRALDPPHRRQRTLDAVKRLLLREAQVQPILVVFEDLHWIDPETQTFLDSLMESLPSARLLLLVNYRPEYEHHWGSKTSYTQLRLDALPPQSALELLRGLLGEDATVRPLELVLIERTQGNPFFLEESVRTLVETRTLVGERGAYRLAAALIDVQVPPTVQAVLAARIDRLSPEGKRLLQSAAVIGKDVPLQLLAAIAEVPEVELRRELAHLQAAEFLYEVSLFPDVQYTFKHALTHEVAYGGVLISRRRILHGRIVESIETLAADRVIEYVAQLAHHSFQAAQWERALRYARQAAVKAQSRSAYREAVSRLEQALQALEQLPSDPEALAQAIDVRLELRNSLFALGDHARIIRCLREAATLAQGLADQRRLARTTAILALSLWATGEHHAAIEAAREAQRIATALGDETLTILANFYLGVALNAVGDYRASAQHLGRNVELLGDERWQERCGLMGPPAIFCRAFLSWSLAELGEFTEAKRQGEEGVRLADLLGQPYTQSNALVGLSSALIRCGELTRVPPVAERALALCETWNLWTWLPAAAADLGYAYAVAGRVADGLELLERALREVASMNMRTRRALILVQLGEILLSAGRLTDAREAGKEALILARELGERGHEAWALWLLAEIAAMSGGPASETVRIQYAEALALARSLNMRPLDAHCHLGLGKLYRRTGETERAREHLTSAIMMYREMDMRFWLEQAEAEMGELV
jgi:class 3 adenylate cyclase/tetratricopeptide (TPR) repeat protein